MSLVLLGAGLAGAQQATPSNYGARPAPAAPATRWTAPVQAPSPAVRIPAAVPPAAASSPSGLVPARFQQGLGTETTEEDKKKFTIQLDPPGLMRISQLDSDLKLQERIKQETRDRDPTEPDVNFPASPILSYEIYQGRGPKVPYRPMVIEPNFVNHKPLYFQDLNAERYGWDLGFIHPLVSAGKFTYDFVLLPMHLTNNVCDRDSSTGYCLPGDPVPFLLYPPEVTYHGTLTELATIVALVAIFP